jgi:hypothetical protein
VPLTALICFVTEVVQEEESFECGSRPGAVQLIASLTTLQPFQKCSTISIYFEGFRKQECPVYGSRFEVGISHFETESLIRTLKFYAALTVKSRENIPTVLTARGSNYGTGTNFFSSQKRPFLLRGLSSPFFYCVRFSFLGLQSGRGLNFTTVLHLNAKVTILIVYAFMARTWKILHLQL